MPAFAYEPTWIVRACAEAAAVRSVTVATEEMKVRMDDMTCFRRGPDRATCEARTRCRDCRKRSVRAVDRSPVRICLRVDDHGDNPRERQRATAARAAVNECAAARWPAKRE